MSQLRTWLGKSDPNDLDSLDDPTRLQCNADNYLCMYVCVYIRILKSGQCHLPIWQEIQMRLVLYLTQIWPGSINVQACAKDCVTAKIETKVNCRLSYIDILLTTLYPFYSRMHGKSCTNNSYSILHNASITALKLLLEFSLSKKGNSFILLKCVLKD